VDPAELSQGAALRSVELDFDELIRLAVWHGIAPLLASHLESLAGRISEPASTRLQQLQRQVLLHNLRLSTHLIQILKTLEARNIPSIPFKGPLLSERLYGNVALRQCSDLDLLVRPEDLPLSLAALQTMGFESEHALRPELIAALVATDFEITLIRDGVHLDLHWDVMPPFYGIAFGLNAAWQRARRTKTAGAQILEFAPEDLFLALALHASKHFWAKLIWLSDLRQLLQASPIFDWGVLLERARCMRVERILLITLALLQDVFDCRAPLAPAMLEDLRARNGDWYLTYETARDNLCSTNPEIEGLRTYCFFLRMRDRRFDAVRQVIRHATTPASAELFMTNRSFPALFYLPLHLWRLMARFFFFVWHPPSNNRRC
jgi:hypothetical protein